MSESTTPDYGTTQPADATVPSFDAAPPTPADPVTSQPASPTDTANLSPAYDSNGGPTPDAPTVGTSYTEAPQIAENTAQAGQTVGEAGVQWTGLPDDAPVPDYALPQKGEPDGEQPS